MIALADKHDQIVKNAVIEWVEENEHNPEFQFVVGNRAFTPEEIKENIKKGTPEGDKILDMVAGAATHLLLRPKANR